ncbi:MAG: 50S ribosomal protein L32 [Candidatus Ryanbacteria bacterium RIFCSPHIGHO2_01_FULL_45_22]|uniref:Large ribosomal subunit protein bL32 n=1 Tax=Candidatus Ryanbacteria bacterium RIFCSPHIGHO2_01_FULL_45_22 TaxID=1802114 RepID=A0A1G2G371_9BACT|nr:MAG: 50S ribosomal protein L32 [Candidatus Ryanbacteria bacterium RIFCSPHIGHO2_01_FULL_45_22]
MSIRMRHTKGHRNERRQHLKLKQVHAALCPKCKSPVQPHVVCANCGTYRGRQMIDVLAKLTKKERKQKEKELKDQESDDNATKQLTPEALSRK